MDNVLDKYLEKIGARIPSATFAYDTKQAELSLWQKTYEQVDGELNLLKGRHIFTQSN